MMQLGDIPAATGEWECMECGYVEEGVAARRPQVCPDCGAPAEAFEFFSFEDAEEEWEEADEEEDLDEDLEDENVF
jgi:predicted  nucleic acid-binding Zn-ribbon protein